MSCDAVLVSGTHCAPLKGSKVSSCAGVGGNFIDTAECYPVPVSPEFQGESERIVGRWLKERNCRDEFVIATKA